MGEFYTGNRMGKEKRNASHIQVSASRRTCMEWRQQEIRLESARADKGGVDRA